MVSMASDPRSAEQPGRPRLATKSGEALARRIRAEIMAEGWPVGRLIGTEPELLKRYQVSRPVLREAVRLLEHHMIVESRRGAGGGLRVTAPEPSAVAETAAGYLDYLNVSASQMYSARATLEVRCLELAVERLNVVGTAQLRDVVARLRSTDDAALSELSHVVETIIADMSGDPVLTLFVKVLLQLAQQHGAPIEERLADQGRLKVWRDQQLAVAEAVIAGDAAAATEFLLRYLSWAEGYARRHFAE
jgi:DNA-binding FadR family transcriptional regulator